jgi:hypothetical protein
VCIIENALAKGNLELGFNHNDESVLAVNFKANFDSADLTAEPWKIRYPTIA